MSRRRVSRHEPRPPAHLAVSDEVADRALAVIQPHAPRQLSREEARMMAGRLIRFAEILLQAGPLDPRPDEVPRGQP
jgi:regulator of sirC expression with transglutaminase-like and TPR domain